MSNSSAPDMEFTRPAAAPSTSRGFTPRLIARVLSECAPGTECSFIEVSDTRCRIRIKRPEFDPKAITYERTVCHAIQAGVFDERESRRYWTQSTAKMLAYFTFRHVADLCFPHVTVDGETLSEFIERNPPVMPGDTLKSLDE